MLCLADNYFILKFSQGSERLAASGYRTLFSGKWHLGVEADQFVGRVAHVVDEVAGDDFAVFLGDDFELIHVRDLVCRHDHGAEAEEIVHALGAGEIARVAGQHV